MNGAGHFLEPQRHRGRVHRRDALRISKSSSGRGRSGSRQTLHAGSGGGAGKCTVEDLTFDHYTDRASPNLIQYCLTGKHRQRHPRHEKGGRITTEYLKMTMEDVLVTQVTPVYYNTMRVPRERVALSFSRFRQEYVVQNASGGSAGTVAVGYDVKANAVI